MYGTSYCDLIRVNTFNNNFYVVSNFSEKDTILSFN